MGTELQLYGVDKPSVLISPEANEAKRVALITAKACTEVKDIASQETASRAQAAVKNLIKQVEASHAEIKAPILKIGREIDGVKNTFLGDLIIEERRLALLVGSYQEAEQRRRRQAEEDARRKEQERLERAKQEERLRISKEIAGHTGTLLTDLQTIRQRVADDVATIRQDAANAAVAAPTGSMTRKNWKFEVTDLNALFRAAPELCTIAPNNAAIRAVIKNNQKIPGLRVWSETVSIATARSESALPEKVDAYDY